MAGKYGPLTAFLADVPEGQLEVALSFARLDALVGGLPPSAWRLRTWWANNSQGHSLAWNRAGWRVSSVDLAGRNVTFARGPVGGTYAARRLDPSSSVGAAASAEAGGEFRAVAGSVAVRVSFVWSRAGAVALDRGGKLVFPSPLPAQPGLYRLTLVGSGSRDRVYVGESDNLRRRLGTNYRNPGPRQRTSLRVNGLLVEHVRGGGVVSVDLATEAVLERHGVPVEALDLSRKAGRLLAENAALVVAALEDAAEIQNLG